MSRNLKLRFDPFPVLETARLLIRDCTHDDVVEVMNLRSDMDAMRYLDRPKTHTLEQAHELIQRMQDTMANEEGMGWAICLKDDPKLIGTIGFYRLKKENFRGEIGYMILPAYWKQGYMTEALTAVIDFGFRQMGLHTIEADINPENVASRQLLLKLGFEKEAYFRQNFYFEGNFLDSEIYGLVNLEEG